MLFKESLFGAMGHCGAALPTYEAQKHRLKKKKKKKSGDLMKNLHKILLLYRMEKGNISQSKVPLSSRLAAVPAKNVGHI